MTATEREQPVAEIRHPLDRLRGGIRSFVVYDGLLTAGQFVIAWFWLGLLVDFGLFKVSGFDWVLDAPKWFRVAALAVLGVLLLGILVTRLAFKLTRQFSYSSLALVLEKRYPALLQDKLITAVELADVPEAVKRGYSEAMVRNVIEDARERVAKVPVNDVFNWARLRRKAILLGVTAVGTLAAVYGAFAAWTGGGQPFARPFADTAAVWGERNLLLMSTPWPRTAHLELVGFPAEELRIGKDAPPPKVRAKAYSWVIADRGATFGWRPLRWADVTEKMLGGRVPTLAGLPADAAAWDADRVQAESKDPEVAKAFEKLTAAAAKAGYSRTLRKLEIPSKVVLSYFGEKTRGTQDLTAEPGNEFAGEAQGLKETVRFTVRGGDFATRPRQITLVPPPQFLNLSEQQYQPAYRFHTPPVNESFAALKGLKQVFAEKALSLTGDKTVVGIISGTEVVFRGTSDKPLSAAYARPKVGKLPGVPAGGADPAKVAVTGDGRDRVELSFRGADAPTANTEFEFALVDDDGVESKRTVLIQVSEDAAPQVELAVDVLRKVGNAYMVTANVRVPFLTDSKVRDDTGLSNVEFVLTYTQVESSFFVDVQKQYLAGIFAPVPAVPMLPAAIMPAVYAAQAEKLVKGEARKTVRVPVPRYTDALTALGRDTADTLRASLTKPVEADKLRVVREVKLQNPDVDVFDLKAAAPSLGGSDATGVQPRYRAELNVVATDVNVDTGPKTGQNLEPIKLTVVSEAELLMEISKDEELLTAKIDEALKLLRQGQSILNQTSDRLYAPNPPNDLLLTTVTRANEIGQLIGKAKDTTAGVVGEYRRLYREAEVNQCSETLLKRYRGEIIDPLQAVVDGPFPASEQAHAPFLEALAGGKKPADAVTAADKAALTELIRQLTAVRDRLGEVLTLSKLRDAAVQIATRQKQLGEVLRRLTRAEVEKLGLPVIKAVPAVELAKGGKAVVKHPLEWGTFSGDDYRVRFEGPADFKLPKEFKVPDDKNEVEYELTAGAGSGEFTVRVIPSVGKAVELVVRVK